ncbi:MAG: hypothetical protein HFG16_00895 [Erysipelotrichaceae bacterium]|jgi:copper chaperone CopZ|nr:hypothetical protein [Erysipelotrichaceae bacterium]
MKSIIMVSDMNCANCAKKIQNALEDTRVKFEIKLADKIVVVDGDSDMVAVAKKVINDIGFTTV